MVKVVFLLHLDAPKAEDESLSCLKSKAQGPNSHSTLFSTSGYNFPLIMLIVHAGYPIPNSSLSLKHRSAVLPS